MSCKSHDNCYCGLNVHKRFDKPLPKQLVLPHYPPHLKTVYAKDYVPLEATQPDSARTVAKRQASQGRLADAPTARKSRCLPATYTTSYGQEFREKPLREAAREVK
jgi:hypothetical protein